MTVNPMDAKTAQMRMQQGDMQDKARQIGNLTGPGGRAPIDKEKKLRESCEGFESIFIQKMWEQMRATVPKNGLMHGREEQFWQGMYDQELSKKMASAGGIGLADMMYDQLSRNLVSASRSTASGVASREGGFNAAAAPLMPNQTAAAAPAKRESSMYEGNAPHVQPATPPAGEHPAEGPAAANAGDAAGETPSVVQQVLAELRQRQQTPEQQHNPAAINTTQVQGTGTVQMSRQGAVAAQMARQVAAAKQPPQGGVLPPMQPMQRQPRIDTYVPPTGQTPTQQANPAMNIQAQNASHVPQAQGAPQHQSGPFVAPPQANPSVQGAQAPQSPLPPQFIMHDGTAAPGMTPPAAPLVQPTPAGQPQAQPAAQQEQQPEIINTTFTTNIPPKNRKNTPRRAPRVPAGQPLIRTLNTAPASPITPNNDPTQEAARAQQVRQNTDNGAPDPNRSTAAPQG